MINVSTVVEVSHFFWISFTWTYSDKLFNSNAFLKVSYAAKLLANKQQLTKIFDFSHYVVPFFTQDFFYLNLNLVFYF